MNLRSFSISHEFPSAFAFSPSLKLRWNVKNLRTKRLNRFTFYSHSRLRRCLSDYWCKCRPRELIPWRDRCDTSRVDSRTERLRGVDGRRPEAGQDWKARCGSLAWCESLAGRNARPLLCCGRPSPTSPSWSTRARFDLSESFRKKKKLSDLITKMLPSFCSSFSSLSFEIFRSSGLLSSCSKIAEFSSACSWSGSYSKALSK